MDAIARFEESLDLTAPPDELAPAVAALWWLRKGDWDQAHGIVQDREGDSACDWVHALLHRQEGDASNARTWYRRAGRAVPNVDITAEATEILRETRRMKVFFGSPSLAGWQANRFEAARE
jgi:hypothetical protein